MLTPTADDQGKQLTCRAENTLIPNSGIEDGFKLEINCESSSLFLFLLSTLFLSWLPFIPFIPFVIEIEEEDYVSLVNRNLNPLDSLWFDPSSFTEFPFFSFLLWHWLSTLFVPPGHFLPSVVCPSAWCPSVFPLTVQTKGHITQTEKGQRQWITKVTLLSFSFHSLFCCHFHSLDVSSFVQWLVSEDSS